MIAPVEVELVDSQEDDDDDGEDVLLHAGDSNANMHPVKLDSSRFAAHRSSRNRYAGKRGSAGGHSSSAADSRRRASGISFNEEDFEAWLRVRESKSGRGSQRESSRGPARANDNEDRRQRLREEYMRGKAQEALYGDDKKLRHLRAKELYKQRGSAHSSAAVTPR